MLSEHPLLGQFNTRAGGLYFAATVGATNPKTIRRRIRKHDKHMDVFEPLVLCLVDHHPAIADTFARLEMYVGANSSFMALTFSAGRLYMQCHPTDETAAYRVFREPGPWFVIKTLDELCAKLDELFPAAPTHGERKASQ
jgi:hypothetical protein